MFVVFFFRRLASGEAIMSEILLKLPIVPFFPFFMFLLLLFLIDY